MKKQEVITFKVDDALMELIKAIPNRSEFIRHAILQAMDNVCPLCQGSGIFSVSQRKHWNSFLETHAIERCTECNEIVISCINDGHEAHNHGPHHHSGVGRSGHEPD